MSPVRCRARWSRPRTPISASITASIGVRCARRSTTPRMDGTPFRRRLHHHPAGREKPVPLAGPGRRPQGARTPAGDAGSISCWPSSGSWRSDLNIAELGPSGQFGAEAGSQYAFGKSAAGPVAAGGGTWPRSCPIRSDAAPARRARASGGWPGPMGRGRRPLALHAAGPENRWSLEAHFRHKMSFSAARTP